MPCYAVLWELLSNRTCCALDNASGSKIVFSPNCRDTSKISGRPRERVSLIRSTPYRREPSTPTLRPTNGRPNVVDADGSPPLFSQVIKTLRFYHWLHCPKEYQLPITVSLAAPFKYRQSSKAIHAGSSGTQVPKVLGIFSWPLCSRMPLMSFHKLLRNISVRHIR